MTEPRVDMTTPALRQVSRVLVVDSDDRVLLLRFRLRDGREVWIPPGGGVEAGETLVEAALREVREETTIVLDGPLSVAWSRGTHYFGRDVLESYFLARVSATPDIALEPVPGGPADLLEYRWWTGEEIAADDSGVEFTPPDLASRLSELLAERVLSEPARPPTTE